MYRSLSAILLCLYVLSGCDAINDLIGGGPTPEEAAEAEYLEGMELIARDGLAGAEEHFARARQLNPEHGQAALMLGDLFSQTGRNSRALLELGTAERLLPDSIEIHVIRGNIFFSQGRYLDSARSFRRAVARGAPPHIARRMVVALIRAGEIEAARLELDVMSGSQEAGPGFAAVEGLLLAAEGRIERARSRLETAAEASSDAEAPFALGWFLIQHGDAGGAVRALRQAVGLGGDISAILLLVEALIEAGQAGEALSVIEPYTVSRSNDPLILAAHAQALIAQGQYQQAFSAAGLALRQDPRLAPALVARGAALESIGEMDAAIAAYRKAAREAPEYVQAFRRLAQAYQSLGRNTDAMAALERVVSLDPSCNRSAVELLELYVQTSANYQRGLDLVKTRLDANPGDLRLLRLRRSLQEIADEDARVRRSRPSGGHSGPQIIRGR